METKEPSAETIVIPYEDILSRISGLNIWRGNMREAKRLVVRTNLSKTWHWSPIEGLTPDVAIKKTYDFIRQEIARMTVHPETGISHTVRRKKGIVIGVARAVSTERYGIDASRLFAGEMDTPKLVLGDDGAVVIKEDVESMWKEELSKPLNLSETEKKVIQKLHLLALGMIPLQGYSLFSSSYHYDDLSVNAYEDEEKRALSGCDQLSWWWNEDLHALRDALWHKAGHPVKISFKKEMASSITVKQLLVDSGVAKY